MKKKTPFRNIDNNKPSCYLPFGRMIKVGELGLFRQAVQRFLDEDETESFTYQLSAISKDFIYYTGEEGETIMFNRDMHFISDNIFSENDLAQKVGHNEGLSWISEAVSYWQQEEYVNAYKVTPSIKEMLLTVDIDKLLPNEKMIYFNFLNNGPVKYTKDQCLIAVIADDVAYKKMSKELTAIRKLLLEQ